MSGRDSGARRLRTLLRSGNRAMRAVVDTLARTLEHDVNILILGEPGTGKNFLAESIHACGSRASGPFVPIECAAIPTDLFEAELFGYEKGAFTDAQTRKIGRIELAQQGTVYFDEVANIPPALQAKLLRLIQERTFSRLGSNQTNRLDVRVISSSNLELAEAIASGQFRQDLYYRLNVLTVHLPPLRERPEDIEPLALLFLGQARERLHTGAREFDDAALEMLRSHSWPGNLRELRNVVDRASIVSAGERITPADLPGSGFAGPSEMLYAAARDEWPLEELERRYVREILRRTGGNFSRAAAILGINRKTLFEKRKRWGLD